MDRIRILKEKREDIFTKIDRIMKDHEVDSGRRWTAEIDREVAGMQEEIQKISDELKDLEKYERSLANGLDERSNMDGYLAANKQGEYRPTNKMVFADIARALKFGPGAKGLPENVKALTSTSGSAAIQDPAITSDIIWALQERNELTMAGVQFVNIENYRQTAKVTEYPAVNWQNGEGNQIPLDTALTISSVKWELKDMAIRIRVSNQFLMDSSDRGRRLVQESMRKSVQAGLGRAVFTGTGATGQPQGIENFSGLQEVDLGGGEQLDTWARIIQGVKKLADVNVPISSISAFGSPEVWKQMASMADLNGQPIMKPELLKPVTFYNPTNFVPETYDTNTTTKLFLGDYSKIIVGLQGSFEFVLDQVRADYLETEFLIHLRADIKATHEDNFCQIKGILIS